MERLGERMLQARITENLMGRFPQATRAQVESALTQVDGHGGKAAQLLEDTVGAAQASPLAPSTSTVAAKAWSATSSSTALAAPSIVSPHITSHQDSAGASSPAATASSLPLVRSRMFEADRIKFEADRIKFEADRIKFKADRIKLQTSTAERQVRLAFERSKKLLIDDAVHDAVKEAIEKAQYSDSLKTAEGQFATLFRGNMPMCVCGGGSGCFSAAN